MPRSSVHLTIDLDWAPDFAIEMTLEILAKYDVPATFFVTHPTSVIEKIEKLGHEVGLHPNWSAKSSQGSSIAEVAEYFKGFARDSRSFRTHGLLQAVYLFEEWVECFENFDQIDFSMLVYKTEAKPNRLPLRSGNLIRIPYHWEDSIAIKERSLSTLNNFFLTSHSCAVYNFHPVHLYINTQCWRQYRDLVSESDKYQGLQLTPENIFNRYTRQGVGARDYFIELLSKKVRFLNHDELVNESLRLL